MFPTPPLLSLLFPFLSFFCFFSSFLSPSSFSFILIISFDESIYSTSLSDIITWHILNTNADLLIKRLLPFPVYIISTLFCISLKIHRWSNFTRYHSFWVLMMVHWNRNVITVTFFYIKFFSFDISVFQ